MPGWVPRRFGEHITCFRLPQCLTIEPQEVGLAGARSLDKCALAADTRHSDCQSLSKPCTMTSPFHCFKDFKLNCRFAGETILTEQATRIRDDEDLRSYA